jgi:Immunity protein 49
MIPKVDRHPWWTETLPEWFHRQCARYEEFLHAARRTPRNLHLFFTVADGVYLAGSVVDPTNPHVTNALRWCAQALTAIFVFQEEQDWPTDFVLGNEVVHYTEPASPHDPDLFLWHKAFHLSLISRQPSLTDHLGRVHRDDFRHSAIVGVPSQEYLTLDLDQAIWGDPDFVHSPAFTACEAAITRNAADPAARNNVVRRISVPYMNVARALGQRDSAAFQAALVEALESHKAHWTSSEKLRQELKGMVSLHLTGLAALAWDRGMRFEVDSGYLPWPWATGELFK